MWVHRIDGNGQYQTLSYPTHQHLLQILAAANADNVCYPEEPTAAGGPPRFCAYLSLRELGPVFILCLRGGVPTASELQTVHRWVRRFAATHAYPFLRLAVLPPTPNQSRVTPEMLRGWCDDQLDALTRHHVLLLSAKDHPAHHPTTTDHDG